jgi:hypothetical protein
MAVRWCFLAGFLLFVSIPVHAMGNTAGNVTDTDSSVAASVDPCAAIQPLNPRWWDATQKRLSHAICWPGRWVDSFFANSDDSDPLASGTTLRVTQEETFRDNGQRNAPLDVQASVELPNLERRFKLLFINDDETQRNERDLSDEQAADLGVSHNPHGFRSALRWALRQSQRINLDWDVGVRSGLHGYSRLRYRWLKPVSSSSWVRLTQKVYFRDPYGFSSESVAEYNHSLSPVSSLRFVTDGLLSEENNEQGIGWVLSQSAAYYYRLTSHSAIQYQVGAFAYTQPAWAAQKYRASILYRRNIFRPWLFYEVEPFWEWPKAEDFGTVTGISLRLEVLFGYYQGSGF